MPSWGRFLSRAAICSMPSLLKPKRLIAALSSVSRKSRGLGLPGCGSGVAAPTSIKPKPDAKRPLTACAFLSKPAASPTGLGNSSEPIRVRKRGDVGGVIFGAKPSCSALIASPWAVSGSSFCRALKPNFSRSLIANLPEKYGRRTPALKFGARAHPLSTRRGKDAEKAHRRATAPTAGHPPWLRHHRPKAQVRTGLRNVLLPFRAAAQLLKNAQTHLGYLSVHQVSARDPEARSIQPA